MHIVYYKKSKDIDLCRQGKRKGLSAVKRAYGEIFFLVVVESKVRQSEFEEEEEEMQS